MKAKLLHDSWGHSRHRPNEPPQGRELDHHVFLKAGTIIDEPTCWVLVRNGHADPADLECAQKALDGGNADLSLPGQPPMNVHFPSMTKEQIALAKEVFIRAQVGRLTGNPKLDAPDPNANPRPTRAASGIITNE